MGERWQILEGPALYTLAALQSAWTEQPPQVVAGSALSAFGDALPTGDAVRVERPIDRAAATMRLAQQLWRDGAGVDAALALPRYLRDKVALTQAERQALRERLAR